MPSVLALLICVLFVGYFLRIDYKKEASISLSLWLPTVWFLYSSSKPLGIWIGQGGEDIESGSSLDRVFLAGLFLLALFVLSKKQLNWKTALKNSNWLIFLMFYMFVSISWSNIPDISFKRWIREAVAVVMGLVVASEQFPRSALKTLIRRSIYILIPFSYILINYYPIYGRRYGRWSGQVEWIGVSLQKNGLCRLCIFSILFLAWTFARRRGKYSSSGSRFQAVFELGLFILALRLLLGPKKSLSYSATSIVALVVGLIFLLSFVIFRRFLIHKNKQIIMTFIVAIMIYGIITPFLGGLRIVDISSFLGRDETLTGRTEIWAIMIPLAMKHPIIGYGFGGFWTNTTRSLASSHAHNGYLEVILGLGFIGLIVTSAFLLECCRRAFVLIEDNDEYGIIFLCYLIMTVVHNIGEPSIDSFSTQLMATILFFLFASSYPIDYNETIDNGRSFKLSTTGG